MPRQTSKLLLALTLAVLAISCSKQQQGSDLLDMGVSGGGLIMQTDEQSCVDVSSATSPPTRSITGPALHFSGFSILWKSQDSNLYVGQIKVTVKSPKVTAGKISVTLDSAEIEALLGAANSTLKAAADDKGRLYASNNASKETSAAGTHLAACGFNVGGITLITPTTGSTVGTFTATVQIDLIGTAQNTKDATQESVVLKTVTTNATYYD